MYRSRRSTKLITVYEVMFHVADDHPQAHGGAAGDGSFVQRFRRESDANAFAKDKLCYGKPADVRKDEVPRHIAERWGCA